LSLFHFMYADPNREIYTEEAKVPIYIESRGKVASTSVSFVQGHLNSVFRIVHPATSNQVLMMFKSFKGM